MRCRLRRAVRVEEVETSYPGLSESGGEADDEEPTYSSDDSGGSDEMEL
jgi:hypothetical protein